MASTAALKCFIFTSNNFKYLNIITNFNFAGADPVASAIALKLTNAIKVKCTQEECLAILREIPDDEPDQTVNPTRVGFLTVNLYCSVGMWIMNIYKLKTFE